MTTYATVSRPPPSMVLHLPLARIPNATFGRMNERAPVTLTRVRRPARRHLLACAALAWALGGTVCAPAGAATQTLRGRTIALDPGHNGGNGSASAAINRQVAIGGGRRKACDTTGTSTNAGYPEAAYTWDVALRARRVLRNRGAKVVLSRANNRSVGPCID